MANLKDLLARKASGEDRMNFDPTGRDEQRLLPVRITSIEPDPDQPRKVIGDVTELADSIREHGLLQPIIVEPIDGGRRYRILAGHRRYKACQEAGLTTISCVVRTVEEQSRLALQIIENLHRENLNPVDEARGFKRLMDEFNLNQRELAKRLGKSLGSINQTLRVLDLSEEVLSNVQTSEHLSKSVLLEIAKEEDPKKQIALFEKAKVGELTVRKARDGNGNATKKTKSAIYTIALKSVTLTLRFQKKNPTKVDRLAALEEALGIEKKSKA